MISVAKQRLTSWSGRYRLLWQTLLVTLAIAALKLVVDLLGLEFFHVSTLFTSVVGGGIFLISVLLAGTLADYKESEKLPSEMSAALEAIHEDGRYLHETHAFNPVPLTETLASIVESFRADLADGTRKALAHVVSLSEPFLEMERLGVPPNYIIRLKQEQGTLRKSLLRIYHIQRIQFVPSAHILVNAIIATIIGLLIFTSIEPVHDSILLVAFVSFLFIYLTRLIRVIDTPFRVDEYTQDDVSLFLLRETRDRLRAGAR